MSNIVFGISKGLLECYRKGILDDIDVLVSYTHIENEDEKDKVIGSYLTCCWNKLKKEEQQILVNKFNDLYTRGKVVQYRMLVPEMDDFVFTYVTDRISHTKEEFYQAMCSHTKNKERTPHIDKLWPYIQSAMNQ